MRAIQLYAAGIADAVLEGRSAIPEVPTGEDEFVELDEEGKPKPKTGAPAAARRGKPAAVRKKTPARRRAPEKRQKCEPVEEDVVAAEVDDVEPTCRRKNSWRVARRPSPSASRRSCSRHAGCRRHQLPPAPAAAHGSHRRTRRSDHGCYG